MDRLLFQARRITPPIYITLWPTDAIWAQSRKGTDLISSIQTLSRAPAQRSKDACFFLPGAEETGGEDMKPGSCAGQDSDFVPNVSFLSQARAREPT
jgi:hypothetical protein